MLFQDERQEIDIAEEEAEQNTGVTPQAEPADKAEAEAEREAEKVEEIEAHIGDDVPSEVADA